MTDQTDVQFGSPDCTCIPWTRQGGVPRYCGPGDTVDMISGWERRRDCPHHAPAPAEAQPEADGTPVQIVHRRQPLGSGLMPCCGLSPAETPGQRQTTNPEMVTCSKEACARCGHSEGEGCGCPPDADLRDETLIKYPSNAGEAFSELTRLQDLARSQQAAIERVQKLLSHPGQTFDFNGFPVVSVRLILAALDPQEQP